MSDPLRDAAETMRQVRATCVWSQRITHRDLVPYLIEESHEVIEAVESGSPDELREELGDLLWQVLFHAAVAADDGAFDIDDVARGLTEKMVRRHPHVFGEAVATTPEEVLVHWNAAKDAEKRERRSVLDGVPVGMPALARAQKVLGRADRVLPAEAGRPSSRRCAPRSGTATPHHTDPPVPERAPDLPVPERAQRDEGPVPERAPDLPVPERAQRDEGPTSEADLGDALLALVALARENGWDAERALRERIRLLEAEVRAAETGP